MADFEGMDASAPSRLFVYNGGFLTQARIRRILTLSGYQIRLGRPGPDDVVGVWGASPTAHRGAAVAERTDAPMLRVEDAFLRSLHPGRAGEPPLGLHLDRTGLHFDGRRASDLETLLSRAPLDDRAVLDRARDAMARMKASHLSKYSGFDPSAPVPEPGYVLVVDQTRGDASVTCCGADRATFVDMLVRAQEDNPGARVIIKSHPETQAGYRAGHFEPTDATARVTICTQAVSPWALLEGAIAVYTVSSQLGFEAILAGHKPHVFGQPFYAGWGLSEDYNPVPRRQRRLTRTQLFAGAMIDYPVWYDPFTDRLCGLERVLDILEAQARAWREDHRGWTASGMRLWKRKPLQRFFGQTAGLRFEEDRDRAKALSRPRMVWAGRAGPGDEGATRIEDGFLRSRGLGAELVPPLSLVTDDLGIYYDPTAPSRLERWIATRETLRPDQALRAERLIRSLVDSGVSKYNLPLPAPDLPAGHKVLVPGQVEDDASIQMGAGSIRTNLDLLHAVRAARPNAVIVYKPHPDVEAGLRPGALSAADLDGVADVVADHADPVALLDAVHEVWTMTSLLGFEALLRKVPVTTLGAPFYAGWGLTDRAPRWEPTAEPGGFAARRAARPTLEGLVHAALIDYPRYLDPVSGQPCPVEVVVDRLQTGQLPRAGLAMRSLSKLQGVFASWAWVWR